MNDPVDMRAWQRLDERTTTSGALKAEDAASLAAIGVRSVINLAMEDHPDALANERDVLAAHGINYTHIPVPFDAPNDVHFDAFRRALENADGAPVHVHCIVNYRVSAFFYRLNRDHQGMPEADARALMEKQWSPDSNPERYARAWADFIR